jgi:hypothetical protein
MKLEFFKDGNAGAPMLPPFAAPRRRCPSCARRSGRGTGRVRQLAVHNLPFVEVVDDCRLRAILGPKDIGIVTTAPTDFTWTLDADSWEWADELLAPFCREEPGLRFQYLNPARGPEVLYSTERLW